MKRILVVTGTRAEYGLLRPVIRAIARHPQLHLQLAVTGTHLEKRFGSTINEIQREWPVDAEIPLQLGEGEPGDVARAVGRAVLGMADAIARLSPQLVLVLGDRFEILGAAVAAVYSGVFLGHIHGGDVSDAGYDEYARHAITKLAHLHFCVSEKSAERVRRLGEDARFVFNVGAPGLDTILHTPLPDWREVQTRYHLSGAPLALLVQHPVSIRPGDAARELSITLAALEAFPELEIIALYPNADAGGRAMIDVYESLPARPRFHVHPSLPHADYLALLSHCAVLVGNSSSGILEAPSFRVPVVNIGPRQVGRERADNILDVPHDAPAIRAAVRTALSDPDFRRRVEQCKSPYGDGHAGERIATLLADTAFSDELRRKRLHYDV
ncbi:UDP-N-acetylglucosamine 2-epimerase (hydrolyzing) [bacterium]|nr:UDP-N-acetylglucosamine 2-epimerase (hydrolyzing) [bacterium]